MFSIIKKNSIEHSIYNDDFDTLNKNPECLKNVKNIIHKTIIRKQYDMSKFLINHKVEDDLALSYAIILDNRDLVILLLENNYDVNKPDSNNITPIAYAFITKNIKMVKLLILYNAYIRVDDLHYLIDSVKQADPEYIYYILRESIDSSKTMINVDAIQNTTGKRVIESILKNSDMHDSLNKYELLIFRLQNYDVNNISLLLEKNDYYDIDKIIEIFKIIHINNKEDLNILFYLFQQMVKGVKINKNLILFLIDFGLPVNIKCEGTSLIHLAASLKNLDEEIASRLVNDQTDIDMINIKGLSPLNLALRNNNNSLAKILIERNAIFNISAYENDLIIFVIEMENEEILEILLNDYDPNNIIPFHKAITIGNIRMIEMFLKKNANLYGKDESQKIALVLSPNLEIAKLIVSKMNVIDKIINKSTFLHMATFFKNPYAIIALKDVIGSSLNKTRDIFEYTPLELASIVKSNKSIKALYDKDYLISNESACIFMLSDKELTNLLINFNLTFIDSLGRSLLHIAIKYKYYDNAILLIENNIKVNVQDKDGSTPLILIIKDSNINEKMRITLIEKLIDGLANLNIRDFKNKSAIEYAIKLNRSEKCKRILLDYGAILYYSSFDNWTKMNYALSYDVLKAKHIIDECVIKNKFNINQVDDSGNSILHFAVENDSPILSYLIYLGANIHARNKKGTTPLSIADKKGYTNLMVPKDLIKIESLNDTVCHICSELYDESIDHKAVILECSHKICYVCTLDLKRRYEECPYCRQPSMYLKYDRS